jgi:hypothetical protein
MTIHELYTWAVANNVENFQLGEMFSDGAEVIEVEDLTVDTENNLVSINN